MSVPAFVSYSRSGSYHIAAAFSIRGVRACSVYLYNENFTMLLNECFWIVIEIAMSRLVVAVKPSAPSACVNIVRVE